VRAALHFMRGCACEAAGRVEEALGEYEACIRVEENVASLNNAAWLIATVMPSRIGDARRYIDTALKEIGESPNPSFFDTAAEVYAVLGEHERALKFADDALQGSGGAPRYMVHKAAILLRADREADAVALLTKVRAEFADDPAASKAREMLWEIERKNAPEPEEEEIPVPSDDENGAESGGTQESEPKEG
jgi:tetratricopeptide (TPR) repeat protein